MGRYDEERIGAHGAAHHGGQVLGLVVALELRAHAHGGPHGAAFGSVGSGVAENSFIEPERHLAGQHLHAGLGGLLGGQRGSEFGHHGKPGGGGVEALAQRRKLGEAGRIGGAQQQHALGPGRAQVAGAHGGLGKYQRIEQQQTGLHVASRRVGGRNAGRAGGPAPARPPALGLNGSRHATRKGIYIQRKRLGIIGGQRLQLQLPEALAEVGGGQVLALQHVAAAVQARGRQRLDGALGAQLVLCFRGGGQQRGTGQQQGRYGRTRRAAGGAGDPRRGQPHGQRRAQSVAQQVRPLAVAAELHGHLQHFDEGPKQQAYCQGSPTGVGRQPGPTAPPAERKPTQAGQHEKHARVGSCVKRQQLPHGRARHFSGRGKREHQHYGGPQQRQSGVGTGRGDRQ